MKIKIIAVGSIKEQYFKDAINEYIKRLTPYTKVEIVEVDDISSKANARLKEEEQVKEKEGARLLSKIHANDYVVTLDLNQNEFDSVSFSMRLEEMFIKGQSTIVFVIGGSLGLSEQIKRRANESLTLSKMTFTHQMTRVILLEQIYRAFKIAKGEKYHK